MTSTVEKFALNLCMIDWSRNSVLNDLKEEIIDSIGAEQESLMDVPQEILPVLLKEHDRKVKVANTLINLINEFINENRD